MSMCLVTQSYPTLCDPMDCSMPGLWGFSRQNSGVGCHALLQGNLPNPGIKARSPTLQVDSLPSEPWGKPRILEWVAYPFSRASSQPRNWTRVSCIEGEFFSSCHQGSLRILEWVAYPFCSRSSRPRDRTGVSCIAGGFFTIWAMREAHEYWSGSLSLLQGNFPTQALNQGLLHCRRILYQLSYEGCMYS